jgi:ankyrin repeat protein
MNGSLFEAIEQHDVRRLAMLLAAGVDPNVVNVRNVRWSPLMSAVEELEEGGTIEAVILLLQHGASVNVLEPEPDTTPILVAVHCKQIEAARILLSAGADPNVQTDTGDTPLRLSVEQGDYAMARLLLICGAEKTINESGGPSGMNALGRAVWMLNGRIVELLLEFGADPTSPDLDQQLAHERLPTWDATNSQAWEMIMGLLGK